jgi:small GTP-binding protein
LNDKLSEAIAIVMAAKDDSSSERVCSCAHEQIDIIQRLGNQIDVLNQQIVTLESEVSSLRGEFTSFSGEFSQGLRVLESRVGQDFLALQEYLSSLRSQLQEGATVLDSLSPNPSLSPIPSPQPSPTPVDPSETTSAVSESAQEARPGFFSRLFMFGKPKPSAPVGPRVVTIDDVSSPMIITIVGSRAPGKTQLISRFSENPSFVSMLKTVGVDVKLRSMEICGRQIRFQIWDTGDALQYTGIMESYLPKACGYMFVVDLSGWFTDADRELFSRWWRQCRNTTIPAKKGMLVANKCDLPEDEILHRTELQEFARAEGLMYIETSARTNQNVEQAFIDLATAILESFGDGN